LIKLSESINDKNILKCIFFCGIPGAGKSTVNDLMFKNDLSVKLSDIDLLDNLGMLKHIISNDRITGVNIIKLLQTKRKIDTGLLKVDKSYWQTTDRFEYREFSDYLARNQRLHFIDSMLPTVLMSTGLYYDKIKKQKLALEKLGYDCYMIYISCNTETALYRNYMRNRTEDSLYIQSNIEKYENLAEQYSTLFKNNFFEIQNNKEVSLSNLKSKSDRVKHSIFDNNIYNPIGKELYIYMKKNNLKYLSDFYSNLADYYDKHF
jgi:predicted kinase